MSTKTPPETACSRLADQRHRQASVHPESECVEGKALSSQTSQQLAADGCVSDQRESEQHPPTRSSCQPEESVMCTCGQSEQSCQGQQRQNSVSLFECLKPLGHQRVHNILTDLLALATIEEEVIESFVQTVAKCNEACARSQLDDLLCGAGSSDADDDVGEDCPAASSSDANGRLVRFAAFACSAEYPEHSDDEHSCCIESLQDTDDAECDLSCSSESSTSSDASRPVSREGTRDNGVSASASRGRFSPSFRKRKSSPKPPAMATLLMRLAVLDAPEPSHYRHMFRSVLEMLEQSCTCSLQRDLCQSLPSVWQLCQRFYDVETAQFVTQCSVGGETFTRIRTRLDMNQASIAAHYPGINRIWQLVQSADVRIFGLTSDQKERLNNGENLSDLNASLLVSMQLDMPAKTVAVDAATKHGQLIDLHFIQSLEEHSGAENQAKDRQPAKDTSHAESKLLSRSTLPLDGIVFEASFRSCFFWKSFSLPLPSLYLYSSLGQPRDCAEEPPQPRSYAMDLALLSWTTPIPGMQTIMSLCGLAFLMRTFQSSFAVSIFFQKDEEGKTNTLVHDISCSLPLRGTSGFFLRSVYNAAMKRRVPHDLLRLANDVAGALVSDYRLQLQP